MIKLHHIIVCNELWTVAFSVTPSSFFQKLHYFKQMTNGIKIKKLLLLESRKTLTGNLLRTAYSILSRTIPLDCTENNYLC